jgi:hypothetical protein
MGIGDGGGGGDADSGCRVGIVGASGAKYVDRERPVGLMMNYYSCIESLETSHETREKSHIS